MHSLSDSGVHESRIKVSKSLSVPAESRHNIKPIANRSTLRIPSAKLLWLSQNTLVTEIMFLATDEHMHCGEGISRGVNSVEGHLSSATFGQGAGQIYDLWGPDLPMSCQTEKSLICMSGIVDT